MAGWSPVAGELTEKNIEDWDFREVEPGSDADYFLTAHYATVVAVDAVRVSIIALLIDHRFAEVIPTSGEVRLINSGRGILRGMRSNHSRFTREGRFYRQISGAMLREYDKNGRLRLTLLPRKAEKPTSPELDPQAVVEMHRDLIEYLADK
jgi:hypothetical protein